MPLKPYYQPTRALCQSLFNIDYIGAYSALNSPEAIARIQQIALPSTILTAVPLFHASGLHAQLFPALCNDKRLVFMHRWNPEDAAQMIKDEQITQFNGAPSMVLQLIRSENFKDPQIQQSLYALGFGGAGIPQSLIQEVLNALPEKMTGIGYGMTESNGVGAACSGKLFNDNPKGSGLISPIIQVKICAADGQQLANNQVGEIHLRGVSLMQGYLNARTSFTEDGFFANRRSRLYG